MQGGAAVTSFSLPNTVLLEAVCIAWPHQENTILSVTPERTPKHQEAKQQEQEEAML